MTIVSSGAVSIESILTELGRPAGSTIDLNDSQLLQLAGKNAGETISFPSDFYGKSLSITDSTVLTLGNYSGDWRFDTYNGTGSATNETLGGSKVLFLGVGSSPPNMSASVNLTGIYESADIASVTIDETPNDGAITYNSANFISSTLEVTIIGLDPLPTQADYSSGVNVTLSISFNKTVLLGGGILAGTSELPWATGRGYTAGLMGSVEHAHDSFDIGGNNYTLQTLELSTSNDLTLSIDCGAGPILNQSDVARLLVRRATKLVPSVPASDIYTYLTSAASFSTSGSVVTWVWPSLDFFQSGDIVMYSIEG